MADQQGNQEIVRGLTRIHESLQQSNKLMVRLITSVDSLTAATRESYEGPMKLLAELDERAGDPPAVGVADDEDIDELSPEDRWRLG